MNIPPIFVVPKLKHRPITGIHGAFRSIESVRDELQPSIVNIGLATVVPLAGVFAQAANGSHVSTQLAGTVVVASAASLAQRLDNKNRLQPMMSLITNATKPGVTMNDPGSILVFIEDVSRTLYVRGAAKATVAAGAGMTRMLDPQMSLSPEVTAGLVVGYGVASGLDLVRANGLRLARNFLAREHDFNLGRLFGLHR